MSHCRLVVLDEASFELLQQQARPCSGPLNGQPPNDSLCTSKAEEPPSPPIEPTVERTDERTAEPTAERTAEPTTESKDPVDVWLEVLPNSFRRVGRQLLEKLTKQKGFALNQETGDIILKGVPTGYNVRQLLRATCVPFNKAVIPQRLQDWFRSRGITKFRNHLVQVRKPWVTKYPIRRRHQ